MTTIITTKSASRVVINSPIVDTDVTVSNGPKGDPGASGATGPAGPAGVGVPVGGTTGQVLTKASNTDYDTNWQTVSGGGGVSDGDKGDITVSGAGAVWTIDDNVVTNAKLADVGGRTLKGKSTAGTGDPEDISVGTDSVVGRTSGGIIAAQLATSQMADNVTTNAKLADMAVNTIKGRITAGTGDPEDLTGTQVKTILAIAATDVTGLATIATSGSASDLGTGTLPNARLAAFGSGDVSFAAGGGAGTIAADAVTFAKMQNIGTDTLIGRDTAATGDPEAITVTGGIEFSGTGSIRTSAFTGDVTKTAGGTALSIAADAVTNSQLANMAANTVKANATASTADPTDFAIPINTVLGRVAGDIVAAQVVAGQIANGAVTFPKITNVTANSVLARAAATNGNVGEVALAASQLLGRGATGDIAAITLGTNLSMSGTTLNASGSGGSLTVQDEGSTLSTAVTTINFTGAGVTATGTTTVTVNVPGGGGGVTDGDKGDITVSGTGTVWRVDPNVKFGLPLAMKRGFQF